MTKLTGFSPKRLVGETFHPCEPLSQAIFYLVERLLHDELDDERLGALAARDEEASLSETECRLLSERLKGEWCTAEGYDFLAWYVEGQVEDDVPTFLMPRLFREQIAEFRLFLEHCGGFRIEPDSGDEDRSVGERLDGIEIPQQPGEMRGMAIGAGKEV